MTAACGGGSSQPRQFSPAVVFLSGAALTALTVETLGLPAVWADLLGFAAGQSFSTSTFCATDPPAMPTFTAADITTLIGSTPFLSPTAYDKLNALTAIAAWYFFCECTSTLAPPAPPTAPTYPSGGPQVNPPSLPGGQVAPCWDQQNSIAIPASTSSGPVWVNLTPQIAPTGVTKTVSTGFTGAPTTAYAIPSGVNNAIDLIAITPLSTKGPTVYYEAFDSGGTLLTSQTLFDDTGGNVGGQFQNNLTVPTNAAYWMFFAASYWASPTNFATQPFEVNFELKFFCANQTPSTPLTPCCPPDPTLQAKLDQIMNALSAIYAGLPSNPSSFAESTVHAALTGSGNSAIGSGTIALKVELTTVPTSVGIDAGDPLEYLGAGFITTSAAEGAYKSNRIEHTPQLILLGTLVDAFHWTLPPGVVAKVTELVRGP